MDVDELLRRALVGHRPRVPERPSVLGPACESPVYVGLLDAIFAGIAPEPVAAMLAAARYEIAAERAPAERPWSSDQIAASYQRSGLRPPGGALAHGWLGSVSASVLETLLGAIGAWPTDLAAARERVQRYLDAPEAPS